MQINGTLHGNPTPTAICSRSRSLTHRPGRAKRRGHLMDRSTTARRLARIPTSRMLKRSDLGAFVELARHAERETTPPSTLNPESVLRASAQSNGLLHRNELTRLQRSLKVASVAGDVPDSTHQILHTIAQELSAEGFTYMPLARSKEWLEAISWARSHPATPVSDHEPQLGQDRQWVVGKACRALRDRGYRVDIDALGPEVDADTRTEIARRVDSLFAQMGESPPPSSFFASSATPEWCTRACGSSGIFLHLPTKHRNRACHSAGCSPWPYAIFTPARPLPILRKLGKRQSASRSTSRPAPIASVSTVSTGCFWMPRTFSLPSRNA